MVGLIRVLIFISVPFGNCIPGTELGRVSDPMLNPILKSVYFLDYLNFGALFDIFLWSLCQNMCYFELNIGYMPVNIEFAKFV